MSRPTRWTLLAVSAFLVAAWGCATTGRVGTTADAMAPADSLAAAVRSLEAGAYAEAMGPLRWTASRCEAGRFGRRALLLLAATALDPRNPDASPEEAAALAAHALMVPGLAPDRRMVAEVLYLAALEHGAEPPTGRAGSAEQGAVPDTAAVNSAVLGPAPRFDRCGEPVADGSANGAMLPELPGASMATLLRQAEARRDSLGARVTALEAELARIRELLQEAVPVPSDTGSSGGW